MQFRSRQSRVKLLVAFSAIALAIAAIVVFPSRPSGQLAGEPVGQSAMRISLDSETGLMTKSAPRASAATTDADLAAMLNRSDEGLVEVHLPDGSVMVDLQGRFMSTSIARIGNDGQLRTACVHSLDEADAFLQCEHDMKSPAMEVQ